MIFYCEFGHSFGYNRSLSAILKWILLSTELNAISNECEKCSLILRVKTIENVLKFVQFFRINQTFTNLSPFLFTESISFYIFLPWIIDLPLQF